MNGEREIGSVLVGDLEGLVATAVSCELATGAGGGRGVRQLFLFWAGHRCLAQRLTLFERHRSPTPPPLARHRTSCHWSPSLGRLLGLLALYDGPEISFAPVEK